MSSQCMKCGSLDDIIVISAGVVSISFRYKAKLWIRTAKGEGDDVELYSKGDIQSQSQFETFGSQWVIGGVWPSMHATRMARGTDWNMDSGAVMMNIVSLH